MSYFSYYGCGSIPTMNNLIMLQILLLLIKYAKPYSFFCDPFLDLVYVYLLKAIFVPSP